MVVMVPRYTVGDIREAQEKYPLIIRPEDWHDERLRLEFEDHPDIYKIRSIEMEHVYFRWGNVWRGTCQRAAGPYWASEDEAIDPRTDEAAVEWWKGNLRAINVMGSLKPLEKMWSANQLEGNGYKPHMMSYTLAVESLIKLSKYQGIPSCAAWKTHSNIHGSAGTFQCSSAYSSVAFARCAFP